MGIGPIRIGRPSPAMTVAIIALVFAVAGTAIASVATVSVLSKKEKKQTRNIARDEIGKAAPGLSVANAASATTAADALALGGVGSAGFVRTDCSGYGAVKGFAHVPASGSFSSTFTSVFGQN